MTKRVMTRNEYRVAKLTARDLKTTIMQLNKVIREVEAKGGEIQPNPVLDPVLDRLWRRLREVNSRINAWDKALLKIQELEVEIEDD